MVGDVLHLLAAFLMTHNVENKVKTLIQDYRGAVGDTSMFRTWLQDEIQTDTLSNAVREDVLADGGPFQSVRDSLFALLDPENGTERAKQLVSSPSHPRSNRVHPAESSTGPGLRDTVPTDQTLAELDAVFSSASEVVRKLAQQRAHRRLGDVVVSQFVPMIVLFPNVPDFSQLETSQSLFDEENYTNTTFAKTDDEILRTFYGHPSAQLLSLVASGAGLGKTFRLIDRIMATPSLEVDVALDPETLFSNLPDVHMQTVKLGLYDVKGHSASQSSPGLNVLFQSALSKWQDAKGIAEKFMGS